MAQSMQHDAIPTDVSSTQSTEDWRILTKTRCNVLIVGAADAVERSLAALTPSLDTPISQWTFNMELPPTGDVGTLVIRDVDALSDRQQHALARWLEPSADMRARVVSTTTVPLHNLVVAGLFCEMLYYRLNTWLETRRPHRHEVIEPTTVAQRAFRRYLERGGQHGHDVDDWLEAERELRTLSTSA